MQSAQIIMQTEKRAASRSIPAQEVNIVAAPKLANEESSFSSLKAPGMRLVIVMIMPMMMMMMT